MDVQLKKTCAPRPPDKPQTLKHISDFRRKRVRPVPNQVIPDICPVVVQETNPKQQNGQLLLPPSEPHPKLSTCVSHKSVSKEQKPGADVSGNVDKKKKKPLGVKEVMKKYGERLTEFEKEEIQGYSEFWYLGLKATKIQNYEDEKGYYIMVAHDHIAYRYEVLEVMGQGSFGQVLKCRDHKTNETVAVKILRRRKDDKISMTEVKILEALRKKEKDTSANTNTVQMKEHFIFRKHLCITFELLGTNLNEVLKERDRRGLSKKQIHRYACSILECLQVLHDEKIVHGDLKPDNILTIDEEEHSDIKVADFGSGCFQDEQVFSDKGNCCYRAPESLLHQPSTTAMDMWSLGCVLVELHTGRPIFRGKNEVDQLSCIMEVLGMPSTVDMEKSDFWKAFFAYKWKHQSVGRTTGNRHPKSRPLVSILGTTNHAFLDFVQRCLTWDPKMRMTPQEAMQHKWIVKSRSKPHRVYDEQWFEMKDGTGEPSFPKPGPDPLRKGGQKPFCDERLGCQQNMYRPRRIPILKPPVKRAP